MSALVSRVDVPAGTVPPLRSFMRHVWRYRDESGDTVLTSPPGNIFTFVLDDAREVSVAVTILAMLDDSPDFHGNTELTMDAGNAQIGFRNLHVLHAFIQLVSLQASYPPAREVAAYCMVLLGFRWT